MTNISNKIFGISLRSKGEIDDSGKVTITKILSYDVVSSPGFSGARFLTDIDFSEIKRQQLLRERKEKINRLNNIKWD